MTVKQSGITLQEFVSSKWRDMEQCEGLDPVIEAIAQGSIQVQEQVRQAVLADALGTTGETNVQGEIVQILDKFSSNIFVKTL